MSNIRDIPDVKDASGIFKFDAGKKAWGGTGERFQWGSLGSVHIPLPWMLSGGLTPESCADISSLPDKPDGLDFNSGLEEAPGVKSAGLMRKAFAELREAGLGPDPVFDLKGQKQ